MKKPLTKHQEKILNIIKDFINKNGYSPTVREIGKISDLKSTSTVKTYLDILYIKGYITYIPKLSRTIKIIES